MSKRDSLNENGFFHSSLFDNLGAFDFDVSLPQMITRNSLKESKNYDMNPLAKKESFKLYDDINPNQPFNMFESRDYLAFNQLKPIDSSFNESRLFRRDSRVSKKESF